MTEEELKTGSNLKEEFTINISVENDIEGGLDTNCVIHAPEIDNKERIKRTIHSIITLAKVVIDSGMTREEFMKILNKYLEKEEFSVNISSKNNPLDGTYDIVCAIHAPNMDKQEILERIMQSIVTLARISFKNNTKIHANKELFMKTLNKELEEAIFSDENMREIRGN